MLKVGADTSEVTMEWLEPEDGAERIRFSNLNAKQAQSICDYMLLNKGDTEMLNMRSVARAHLTEFDPARGHAVIIMYSPNHGAFVGYLLAPLGIMSRNIYSYRN